MKSYRNERRRYGSLLVQQVILIGVSGMLMMMAIKLIHQTLDFAGIYQSRFNEQRALSVLARTFRSDIHSAVSTKLIDTNQLELTMLAGSRIVYRVEDSKISRQVSHADSAANNSNPPYVANVYRLGNNQSAVFSIEEDLAILSLETNKKHEAGSHSLPRKRVILKAGHSVMSKPAEVDNTQEVSSDEP